MTTVPHPLVGIVMGSQSDLPVMAAAAKLLESLDVPHEVLIVSAHRTPDRMVAYAKAAEGRGLQVIIAGAGGAAHLPGMLASLTLVPVVGVPIKSSNSLEGWDSILSILQMPGGIPVATVALNGALNAGLLAAQIIARSQPELLERLRRYRQTQTDTVLEAAERLNQEGYAALL
jgi:5-(carboxyamino)imidazole ribonucleotide mutase